MWNDNMRLRAQLEHKQTEIIICDINYDEIHNKFYATEASTVRSF